MRDSFENRLLKSDVFSSGTFYMYLSLATRTSRKTVKKIYVTSRVEYISRHIWNGPLENESDFDGLFFKKPLCMQLELYTIIAQDVWPTSVLPLTSTAMKKYLQTILV